MKSLFVVITVIIACTIVCHAYDYVINACSGSISRETPLLPKTKLPPKKSKHRVINWIQDSFLISTPHQERQHRLFYRHYQPKKWIKISIKSLNIPLSPNCRDHKLIIFTNGDRLKKRSLVAYCGKTSNVEVLLKSSKIEMRFESKLSFNESYHFNATYKCVNAVPKSISQKSFCNNSNLFACHPKKYVSIYEVACISLSNLCDGIKQCPYGDDELGHYCKLFTSTPKLTTTSRNIPIEKYRCAGSKTEIEYTQMCDNKPNCPLGDDELCFKDCRRDKFKCTNTSRVCISKRFLCDGTEDCSNGFDENNQLCKNITLTTTNPPNLSTGTPTPGTTKSMTSSHLKCPDQFFWCSEAARCIPQKWVCDEYPDCASAEDEQSSLCDKMSNTTTNVLKTVSRVSSNVIFPEHGVGTCDRFRNIRCPNSNDKCISVLDVCKKNIFQSCPVQKLCNRDFATKYFVGESKCPGANAKEYRCLNSDRMSECLPDYTLCDQIPDCATTGIDENELACLYANRSFVPSSINDYLMQNIRNDTNKLTRVEFVSEIGKTCQKSSKISNSLLHNIVKVKKFDFFLCSAVLISPTIALANQRCLQPDDTVDIFYSEDNNDKAMTKGSVMNFNDDFAYIKLNPKKSNSDIAGVCIATPLKNTTKECYLIGHKLENLKVDEINTIPVENIDFRFCKQYGKYIRRQKHQSCYRFLNHRHNCLSRFGGIIVCGDQTKNNAKIVGFYNAGAQCSMGQMDATILIDNIDHFQASVLQQYTKYLKNILTDVNCNNIKNNVQEIHQSIDSTFVLKIDNGWRNCGIIHLFEQYFLTTANCAKYCQPIGRFQCSIANSRNMARNIVNIKNVILHYQFHKEDYRKHDLAVIQSSDGYLQSFNERGRACIKETFLKKDTCIGAGLDVSGNQVFLSDLHIANKTCSKEFVDRNYSYIGRFYEEGQKQILCKKYNNVSQNETPCYVSGSPIYCRGSIEKSNNSSVYYLAGVAAYTNMNCSKDVLYLDLSSYVNWIISVIISTLA